MSIILNGKTIAGAPPPSDTADAAKKADLTSIIATGATNATGATIASGTYFYLNGSLVLAKADIASGASFTENTNYEAVTAGGLNSLKSALTKSEIGYKAYAAANDQISLSKGLSQCDFLIAAVEAMNWGTVLCSGEIAVGLLNTLSSYSIFSASYEGEGVNLSFSKVNDTTLKIEAISIGGRWSGEQNYLKVHIFG